LKDLDRLEITFAEEYFFVSEAGKRTVEPGTTIKSAIPPQIAYNGKVCFLF